MNTKAHDKILLDLATFITSYVNKTTYSETASIASEWVSKWEKFMDAEYLDEQDADVPEKRVYLLLQMHVCAKSYERKHIHTLLAINLQEYCYIVSTCPSGFYSRDIDKKVADILEPIFHS